MLEKMLENQAKVEDLVYQILLENKRAREDDYILIAEYYYKINPEIVNLKFNYVFLAHKELNLPSFKSIERARRKVQAMYPELANTKTKILREKLREEYKDHYLNY